MEFEGKIRKSKKYWLVEVSALDVMTQGETQEEALFMIEDAILEYIKYFFPSEFKGFKLHINLYKKSIIGVSSNNDKILMSLSLRKLREKSGLTIRDSSEILGSKSPNSYAQYEKGKTRISLDQYEKLLHAANPYQQRVLRVV